MIQNIQEGITTKTLDEYQAKHRYMVLWMNTKSGEPDLVAFADEESEVAIITKSWLINIGAPEDNIYVLDLKEQESFRYVAYVNQGKEEIAEVEQARSARQGLRMCRSPMRLV